MTKKLILIILIMALSIPTVAFAATNSSNNQSAEKTYEKKTIIATDEITLKAVSTAFGKIKLTWEEWQDSTLYTIFRYDSVSLKYLPIGTVEKETEFIDKDVKENTTYFYQVVPTFSTMEKSNSNIVEVTSSKGAPTATAKAGAATATIAWAPVTDAQSYEVYRSNTADGEYIKITTLAATEFKDANLQNQSSYYYKIRAVKDNNMYSDFSAPIATGIILTDSWSSGKLAWPMPSTHGVSSDFGNRVTPTAGATSTHDGIDIPAPVGTPVVAADGGTVTRVTSSSARGIYIEITHGNGLVTRYQHLDSAEVPVGKRVKKGDLVARCGNTGISTGAHLHFEVLQNGTPVDPFSFITK